MSVLIVGGGMSGLSAALFLACHGVPVVLVERRRDHDGHPRLSGFSPRAMETLRGVGLEDEIRRLDEWGPERGKILRAETLAGRELGVLPYPFADYAAHVSPTPKATVDQDQVEPLLRAKATELGADIRFHTELIDFSQDADGVTATIKDRNTGERNVVDADYLLACDGDRSQVRESLGITRTGPGLLRYQLGVLFRADLTDALRGRRIRICLTEHGSLVARSQGRWGFGLSIERVEGLTAARCAELVREAVGLPDLRPEILRYQPWRVAAAVADSFRRGRVFLLGDAAHSWPPPGGYGGQACVLDAHNLAWKLAAVLRGTAGPALLDTYEDERLPLARLTLREVMALMPMMGVVNPPGSSAKPLDHMTVSMGYRYRSSAVLGDSDDDFEDPRTPSGRPGTRAPHLAIGDRLSTLDLYHRELVLLAGPDGGPWVDAATTQRLRVHRFGPDGDGARLHGIDADGAVLVRPDGHIAWRSRQAVPQPAAVLGDVLTRVLAL
jgi:putative polyketide hydroxylase